MRALLSALFALAFVLSPTTPSHATDIGSDYDTFGAVTLAYDGTGSPYVGGVDVVLESATFTPDDTYSLEAGEGGANARNACQKIVGNAVAVVRAGRTGWVKFDPDVSGRVYTRAITPGYDSVLLTRTAEDDPTTTLTQTVTSECRDEVVGGGNETTAPVAIAAGESLYVQVGPKCTDTDCTATVQPGATSLRVYFFPDDSDTDGVPNTTDRCPSTPTGTRVNTEGCPDRDGDSIADTADNCPALAGVALPSPYNGCPAGPTPPFGTNPFVVIVGSDGSLDNTNTTTVTLQLNWPQGAQAAVIGNGDGVFEQRALSPYVTWTLRPATKPEARQVTVRYLGPGIDVNVDAVINLDPVAPKVPKRASISVRKGWSTRLSATDQGSGVKRIEALNAKGKVMQARTICVKASCKNKVLEGMTTKKRPSALRVTDAAGNETRVNVRAAGCPPPAFAVWPKVEARIFRAPDCFRPGARCDRSDYAWKETAWRCTGGYVVPAVRST